MSEVTYAIYFGDQPVQNETATVLTDLDEAKQRARDVSADQPGATITVVSQKDEPQGLWAREVATFRAGKEPWRVDFYGYLMDVDHARLSAAGIIYTDGHSEIGRMEVCAPAMPGTTWWSRPRAPRRLSRRCGMR